LPFELGQNSVEIHLTITNFKNIESMSFSPEHKITLAIAPNGTGKTSFLEAVRFAVTGDAPDSCIRDGCDSTTVDAVLADGTEFSRTKYNDKPSVVKVNGKRTPAKNLDTTIETMTGVNKTTMKVTTSSDVLKSLSPAEFGDFLMSYVPEQLDFDTVCSYIAGITPSEVSELSAVLPSMPVKFGMDKIKDAQTYFFEERKNIKKDILARTGKVSMYTGSKPSRPRNAIESDVKELMKLEGGYEASKTAMKLYEVAVKNKEAAELNVKQLKEKIDANKATAPNISLLTDIQKKLESGKEKLVNIKSMIQLMETDISTFTDSLENLSKPVCPLSGSLICTTDKTTVKTELEELIQSNREGLVYQKKEEEECLKNIAVLTSAEEDYRANERSYSEKTMLNMQYEAAKKRIPILPAKPNEIEERDFHSELAELQKVLDAWKAYEENEKTIESISVLEMRRDTLDRLYKALEPKGAVTSEIMAHYMTIFEDVINKRAAELRTGFTMKFVSEDGVNYYIQTDPSREYRLFEFLSHGEQTLAVFLLLDMLNTLCNTRLLLMDDLNHLDKESFTALYTLITSAEVQDAYDHIILCAVDNSDIVDTVKSVKDVDSIF
jgi:recombinational DNA repair ATPase RecF